MSCPLEQVHFEFINEKQGSVVIRQVLILSLLTKNKVLSKFREVLIGL